jgi:hypothetical protein
MTNLITPVANQKPPPRLHGNARYDWMSAADGEYHLWRDAPVGEAREDSVRGYHRLRLSAREWAMRRGGRIDTRIVDHGRQVWIAIHLPEAGDGQ